MCTCKGRGRGMYVREKREKYRQMSPEQPPNFQLENILGRSVSASAILKHFDCSVLP